jgi:hypothetical protein
VTEASASSRLLKKLTENQLEKTERCIEVSLPLPSLSSTSTSSLSLLSLPQLFAKYSRVLSNTESEIDSLIRTLSNRVSRGDQEAEMELQLLDSDEARYLKVATCLSLLLFSSVCSFHSPPTPSLTYSCRDWMEDSTHCNS